MKSPRSSRKRGSSSVTTSLSSLTFEEWKARAALSAGWNVGLSPHPQKFRRFEWRRESVLLLNIAIPSIIIQMGAMIPPFVVASYIGRQLGPSHLCAFTLASLTGNIFTVSVLQGLFTASDTLSPQAFGVGNEREVGIIAIRGLLVSIVLLLPINLFLVYYMKDILLAYGQAPAPVEYATQWYRIFALGLPFYALYMVIWKFLAAQQILGPIVAVTLVCVFLVLPVVVAVLTRLYGFLGSAWAIVAFQICQAMLLLLYLIIRRPHSPNSWPGLGAWREAFELRPLQRYLKLAVGGVVGMSMWMYWKLITLMVGTTGVQALTIHTVPSQVLTLLCMISMGIGIGLAVRLGYILPHSVRDAQRLVLGVYLASILLFGAISGGLYVVRRFIFLIFSFEPGVLRGCEIIWPRVSFYFFNISIYFVNLGIYTGLGKQVQLAMMTSVFLWIVGCPVAYYIIIVQNGGLNAAWTCIYLPYVVINCAVLWSLVLMDWKEIAASIRRREGLEPMKRSRRRALF